jgi:paraquat-inducible protein A
MKADSAAARGLALCRTCGLLSPLAPRCPRCHARLSLRRPDAVNRCWALLIAAYLLYLPANLLPVMQTRSLFGVQDDTLLSGIAYLWTSGSWLLAAVVCIASVIVPLLKLFALTLLLISVQRRTASRARERTRLYRLVEFVGRWSMLDVYVVTLFAALVQLQSFASVIVGPGILSFAAVVVLSMLAAESFDPRLIWDALPADQETLP